MIGPPSVFDQPRRKYGNAWSTPPNELVSLGTKTGLRTRAPQTNDFPRSKDFDAIADAERASEADLVDVGQSLPFVPVRAE